MVIFFQEDQPNEGKFLGEELQGPDAKMLWGEFTHAAAVAKETLTTRITGKEAAYQGAEHKGKRRELSDQSRQHAWQHTPPPPPSRRIATVEGRVVDIQEQMQPARQGSPRSWADHVEGERSPRTAEGSAARQAEIVTVRSA